MREKNREIGKRDRVYTFPVIKKIIIKLVRDKRIKAY